MQGSHGMAGIQGSTAASRNTEAPGVVQSSAGQEQCPGARGALCAHLLPVSRTTMACVQPAATPGHRQVRELNLATHQLGQLFPGEPGLSHEAAQQPQHVQHSLVCSHGYSPSLPGSGAVPGLPSEAVSGPSFAGSPGMFLSSTESTQAVRTSRRPVVQYFIQEEIYTHLSLAGGAASPGHSFEGTARPVFVQRKEPRFRGSVPDPEPGV